MKCPIDNIDLVMSDRQGIEIDYCPQCRGVWLDRGEIDKIVERSQGMGMGQPAAAPVAPAAPAQQYPQPQQPYQQQHHDERRHHDDDDDDYRYRDSHHGGHNGGHHKKKESWLGDLFD